MAESGKIKLTMTVNTNKPSPSSNADPRFKAVLDQLWALHQRKGDDYGRDGDPYANIRQYERLGIDPWVQCVGDIMENLGRVESFIKNGSLRNDPLENSLLDIASYAIIAYILFNESKEAELDEPEDVPCQSVKPTDSAAFMNKPRHESYCDDIFCRGCKLID